MNTDKTPNAEMQAAAEAIRGLGEHFSLMWADVRKTMILFTISIRKGAELSALEARRNRALKRMAKEEAWIEKKYQKETEKALGLSPAKGGIKSKILEFIIVAIFSLLLFAFASIGAYEQRGYRAIGGEHLLLLSPLFYYVVKSIITDMKQIHKEVAAESKQENNKGAS